MVAAILATTMATTLASGMMSAGGNSAGGSIMGAAGNAMYGAANDLMTWFRDKMQPAVDNPMSDAQQVVGQFPLTYLMQLMGLGPNGTTGGDPMNSYLLKPFNPTQGDVEATPGYQFRLAQGLKSVTNSNAAKGLATSGNALRGAADYSTGLAQSTWQQDYQNDLTNRQTIAGMLGGLQATRQASITSAQQGISSEGSILNQIFGTGSGQYMQGQSGQAAGAVGAGNAWGNAISGGGANASNYMLLNSLMGKNQSPMPSPAGYNGMYQLNSGSVPSGMVQGIGGGSI